MKKITTFLGCVGVVCLFWGCSSDSNLLTPENTLAEKPAISSATDSPASSSSTSKDPSSSAVTADKDNPNPQPGEQKQDTVKQHRYIQDSLNIETPNYSSGVFCWDENSVECQLAKAASDTPQSSASATIDISMEGGGSQVDNTILPTINGLQMVDNRDNKTYNLVEVGGKLWMAQDINLEIASSECFDGKDANCSKYGRLYTFNAAQKACPAGWRLPNREEAQAVIADESYTWSYSGRCKDGECGFLDGMGFHWTTAEPKDGDKNFGQDGAVIIVEKNPDSDYAAEPAKFFQVDSKTKRFSVRCVQE